MIAANRMNRTHSAFHNLKRILNNMEDDSIQFIANESALA